MTVTTGANAPPLPPTGAAARPAPRRLSGAVHVSGVTT
ncbi:hypothetical protein SCANM63S_03257 [Streptomyces canarius]